MLFVWLAFGFHLPVGSGSTSGVFCVVFSGVSGGFCSCVVLTVVVVGTGVVDTKSVQQKIISLFYLTEDMLCDM